jgi:RND superfamily putative drug exporter
MPAVPLRASGRVSPFVRLAGFLSRTGRAVVLGFALVSVAAGVYAASVASRLRSAGLEAPHSESNRVADVLFERLGFGQPDVVAILRTPGASVRDSAFGTRVLDALEALHEDEGVATALTYYNTGLESLVSLDGEQTVMIIDLAGSAAEAIDTLERIEPVLREIGAELEIGGLVAAELLGQEIAARDIAQAERIALPFAALLTLVFFRSAVAALLPVGIGAFSLAATTALIGLLAAFMDVSVFALTVGTFLALGLSLDYSLLVVQRFRDELAGGSAPARAVATTLDTAGRAVWVSALTVAVSVAVLVVVPVPLLRGVGLGAVLAVATAAFGALILLPAALAWLGPRVDLGRITRGRPATGPSAFWLRISEISLRHPWTTAGACIALLVGLALPGARMQSVLPDARILPADSDVRRVEERLADPASFDQAGTWAIQVLIEADGPVLETRQLRFVHAFLRELRRVAGSDNVQTPLTQLDPERLSEAEIRSRAAKPDVEIPLAHTVDREIALVTVPCGESWRSQRAVQLVKAIRELPHPNLRVSVGGPTAYQVDVRQTLSQWGRRVAVLVIVWNLLVLLHGFRSVLVPIKAAVMNLLSLGASYGFLVWAFQDAHLAKLLRFEPPGGIDPTIPVVMFAVVFGLSMDYEVFLLSRIQEEFRKHGDNRRSIAQGLAHTGRIVTSAAAILIVVIGAFATGFLVYVKEVGVGVAAAILLDVTVVRALLVPATMRLMGSWNWWAPAWLGGLPPPDAAQPAEPPASAIVSGNGAPRA